MSYYGQYPFNTNGGALLSKRNYINRKLDEIEQKLLQLGWIEPEQDATYQESITDEYDIPVESAGALLPYRDKVNKRLDFFEEVINSHVGYNDNSYSEQRQNDYYNNNYNDYYTNPQPQTYTKPYTNPQPQTYTKPQEEVKKEVDKVFTSVFG